jgi:hypothetical protein
MAGRFYGLAEAPRRRIIASRKPRGADLGVFHGFLQICSPEGQESFGFSALYFCHLGVFLPFPDFCSLFLSDTGLRNRRKGNKNEDFPRKRPICPSAVPNPIGIRHLKGNKILKSSQKRPVVVHVRKLPVYFKPRHTSLCTSAGSLPAGSQQSRARGKQACVLQPARQFQALRSQSGCGCFVCRI